MAFSNTPDGDTERFGLNLHHADQDTEVENVRTRLQSLKTAKSKPVEYLVALMDLLRVVNHDALFQRLQRRLHSEHATRDFVTMSAPEIEVPERCLAIEHNYARDLCPDSFEKKIISTLAIQRVRVQELLQLQSNERSRQALREVLAKPTQNNLADVHETYRSIAGVLTKECTITAFRTMLVRQKEGEIDDNRTKSHRDANQDFHRASRRFETRSLLRFALSPHDGDQEVLKREQAARLGFAEAFAAEFTYALDRDPSPEEVLNVIYNWCSAYHKSYRLKEINADKILWDRSQYPTA